MRTLVGSMLVAVGLTLAGVGVSAADAHEGSHDWRPCKYEDSRNCVWDARHMGNGEGRSFKVDRNGNLTFISHKRAHHLLDW